MEALQNIEPQPSPYRWVMLALLALLYACFGLVSRSIAPLITPILKDLQISYSQMGFILGSWQLTYIGGSLIAGMLLDRYGIRKSILAGIISIAFSSILRYFSNDFTDMLLAVALFGVGAPMMSVGSPKTISLWFHGKSRGKAVGIYMCGMFIGALFALTLTNSLVMPLMQYSWRFTFVCYGLICLFSALLWWLFAKEAPSVVAGEEMDMIKTFKRLSKIRNVQIVLIMGLLSFAILHGFNNWLPKILEASGMSPKAAGFMASVPIAISIPFLLVAPGMIPSELRGRFIALSALLTIASLVVIMMTSGGVQLAGLILYGACQSSYLPVLTLILMDTPEIEPRFMGSVGGMFFCVAEIGGFGGPFVMGTLVDLTKTFLAGALFCVGLNIMIIVLTFRLQKHPLIGTKIPTHKTGR